MGTRRLADKRSAAAAGAAGFFLLHGAANAILAAMRLRPKPVRRCRTCPLNQGEHCWHYASPRRQWARGGCPGFDNPALLADFRAWQEAPRIKTRRDLRRDAFRGRPLSYRFPRTRAARGRSPR